MSLDEEVDMYIDGKLIGSEMVKSLNKCKKETLEKIPLYRIFSRLKAPKTIDKVFSLYHDRYMDVQNVVLRTLSNLAYPSPDNFYEAAKLFEKSVNCHDKTIDRLCIFLEDANDYIIKERGGIRNKAGSLFFSVQLFTFLNNYVETDLFNNCLTTVERILKPNFAGKNGTLQDINSSRFKEVFSLYDDNEYKSDVLKNLFGCACLTSRAFHNFSNLLEDYHTLGISQCGNKLRAVNATIKSNIMNSNNTSVDLEDYIDFLNSDKIKSFLLNKVNLDVYYTTLSNPLEITFGTKDTNFIEDLFRLTKSDKTYSIVNLLKDYSWRSKEPKEGVRAICNVLDKYSEKKELNDVIHIIKLTTNKSVDYSSKTLLWETVETLNHYSDKANKEHTINVIKNLFEYGRKLNLENHELINWMKIIRNNSSSHYLNDITLSDYSKICDLLEDQELATSLPMGAINNVMRAYNLIKSSYESENRELREGAKNGFFSVLNNKISSGTDFGKRKEIVNEWSCNVYRMVKKDPASIKFLSGVAA